MLRSGDPEGVLQEMRALLAGCQAICQIAGVGAAAMGIPPGTHQLPARPASRGRHGRGFPPDELDLALAVFLLKILMPGFFGRDPPDRASPRKTKKADDFPARKPGEPSVTNVTRKTQFHLLHPWQVT